MCDQCNGTENQDNKLENARTGYQAAVNLWVGEGQMYWAKFNALLVANGIIIAAIGLAERRNDFSSLTMTVMPILGVGLCLFWFWISARSHEFHKYWIYSARELEERHLAPVVRTASRGGDFSDGEPVFPVIDGEKKRVRIGLMGRLLPVRIVSHILILLFAIIYVLVFAIKGLPSIHSLPKELDMTVVLLIYAAFLTLMLTILACVCVSKGIKSTDEEIKQRLAKIEEKIKTLQSSNGE